MGWPWVGHGLVMVQRNVLNFSLLYDTEVVIRIDTNIGPSNYQNDI